ncbi:MAG: nucleoside triphosphate pyrophosphohydrolase [candidate division Zixibacteria bacterium]|nr:nucleoside triphosphate pyrophosphohydrolase [candidate division Zixibacteria bacterium]
MKGPREQYTFDDLVAIMRRLRAPGGCPWDRKQNHRSLLPYLIEETYEVADSIERQNMVDLEEELGDLLLQIVFHAQLAAERKRFGVDGVIDRISRKLIARHPHVFKTKQQLTADEVLGNWERIKLNESNGTAKKKGVLDGLPRSLPALLRAYRMQEKTSRFGFDWDRPEDVLDKVEEEITELRQSLTKRRKGEIEHEMGDLLFALVNLARHLKVDPETALSKTNRRFTRRFAYIEQQLAKDNRSLNDATLDEMDRLWETAKSRER